MLLLTVGDVRKGKAVFTHDAIPARVDDVPVWSSTNPSVLTVVGSDDGMSATVMAVAPGDAMITLTATAGGVALSAMPFDVTVTLPVADKAEIVVE